MDMTANIKDNDFMSTISLLEDARPAGMINRLGRCFQELAEEFRNQRIEFDPLIDFPRDI